MTARRPEPDLWPRLVPAATGDGDEPWEFVLPGAARPALSERTRFSILATTGDMLTPLASILRLLGVTGWPLQISYRHGTVPDGVAPFAEAVAAAAAHRPLRRLRPELDVSAWPAPIDPAGSADVIVVPVDRAARLSRVLHQRADARPSATTTALAVAVFAEAATRSALRGSDVAAVLDAADILEPGAVPPVGWSLVLHRLLPWTDLGALGRFADAAHRCRVDLGRIGASAALEHERLADRSDWLAPAQELATRSLADAGALLREGHVRQAAVLASGALRVLFGRSHHVHAATSPLIDDPDGFLAPVRAAQEVLLPDPVQATEPVPGPAPAPGKAARAIILPGAYPAFAAGLVQALGDDGEQLDLSASETRFANTEMEARTLAELFALDRGAQITSPAASGLARALEGAEVVVADWADKGAALASRLVRPGQRLVIRVNGVDHLSGWLHLIRWPQVDDVIFVSEHVRRAVLACALPGFAHVRQHVIPHPLHVGSVVAPKTPDAEHTLGLIGWAQPVKDPIFALDILGLLRAGDPRWRLILIGPGLPDPGGADERFRQQVEQRLTAVDVRGAVEMTGALSHDDVLTVLPRIGYGLSTSRRESLHLGALEMAATGAVPIVRDWPLYAPLGGAEAVFAAESVVTSPAQAADLIRRRAADHGTRAAHVARTMQATRERHDPDRIAAELVAVILGPGASAEMA